MTPVDESGDEEELAPNGRRRLRVDLFVAGGVLIAVVLIGRAVAGDRPGSRPTTPPAGQSSGTPAEPSFAVPSSVFITRADGQRRLLPALPPRTRADPAACPVRLACFTERAGPAFMLEPVVSRFRDSHVVEIESVRLRDAPWAGDLWFRRLTFRVNGGELSIRIIARGLDARADSGRIGDLLFVRTTLQQYEVITQAPAATGVTLADLRRIAADDRLLTT